MKKLSVLVFASVIAVSALFFSCKYDPTETPPTPTAKLDFKKDFTAHYDISNVDTAGSGHTTDEILVAGRISVTDVVIDTAINNWKEKNHVVLITTFQNSVAIDSQYLY